MDDSTPPSRTAAFVLALILMRKKILRYDGCGDLDGVEVWQMTLMSDRTQHSVVNPRLTEEQIEGVSGQLGAILHGDAGKWTQPGVEEDSSLVPDGGA